MQPLKFLLMGFKNLIIFYGLVHDRYWQWKCTSCSVCGSGIMALDVPNSGDVVNIWSLMTSQWWTPHILINLKQLPVLWRKKKISHLVEFKRLLTASSWNKTVRTPKILFSGKKIWSTDISSKDWAIRFYTSYCHEILFIHKIQVTEAKKKGYNGNFL